MISCKELQIRFMNLLEFFFLLIFPIYVHGIEVGRRDLLPSGEICRKLQDSNHYITCDERSPFFQSTLIGALIGPTQVKRQLEVNEFARQLRSSYYSKIYPSLSSHYASIVWMTNNDYLNGKYDVIENLVVAGSKCKGLNSSENMKQNFIEQIKNKDKAKQLNVNTLSKEDQNFLQEESLKKYMVAALELNRILSSRNGQDSLDRETQNQITRLMDSYPLLSLDKNYLDELERKIVLAYKLQITPNTRRALAYNAEKLLFPKVFESDESLDITSGKILTAKDLTPLVCSNKNLKCESKYDTRLFEKILNTPLSPAIKREIGSSMFVNWKNQLKSIETFCDMPTCNLMNINLDETAHQISLLSKPMQESTIGYACKCGFQTASTVLGDGTKDALSYTLIGGSLLCPFTFGFGCLLAGASGAALTGTVVLESTSDFEITGRSLEIAKKFPNVTTKEHIEDLSRFQSDAEQKVVFSAGTTILSLAGGKAIGYVVLKGGKRILVHFKSTQRIPESSN